jgi:hypothetical protein
MADFSISIERKEYMKPVDMQAVAQVLQQAGIEASIDEEAEKVVVHQSRVANAVKAINDLGYETDED